MRPIRKVKAAGGLLVRRNRQAAELLLIRRRGLWDLPKGKARKSESARACAVREVCEELGVEGVQVLAPLGTTRHDYREDGVHFDKTTSWFLMTTDATEFVPQASEDIDAVRWVDPDEAIRLLAFDTLRALVATHRDLIAETSA